MSVDICMTSQITIVLIHRLSVNYSIYKPCCKQIYREKEGDLTQSYDKIPYTNRKFENQRTTHTNATKNFDYTTIADRLRTVSWSNKFAHFHKWILTISPFVKRVYLTRINIIYTTCIYHLSMKSCICICRSIFIMA